VVKVRHTIVNIAGGSPASVVGSKRKRHGQKFVLVFRKILKLLEIKKPLLASTAIIY
jgi:hypothetical protein